AVRHGHRGRHGGHARRRVHGGRGDRRRADRRAGLGARPRRRAGDRRARPPRDPRRARRARAPRAPLLRHRVGRRLPERHARRRARRGHHGDRLRDPGRRRHARRRGRHVDAQGGGEVADRLHLPHLHHALAGAARPDRGDGRPRLHDVQGVHDLRVGGVAVGRPRPLRYARADAGARRDAPRACRVGARARRADRAPPHARADARARRATARHHAAELRRGRGGRARGAVVRDDGRAALHRPHVDRRGGRHRPRGAGARRPGAGRDVRAVPGARRLGVRARGRPPLRLLPAAQEAGRRGAPLAGAPPRGGLGDLHRHLHLHARAEGDVAGRLDEDPDGDAGARDAAPAHLHARRARGAAHARGDVHEAEHEPGAHHGARPAQGRDPGRGRRRPGDHPPDRDAHRAARRDGDERRLVAVRGVGAGGLRAHDALARRGDRRRLPGGGARGARAVAAAHDGRVAAGGRWEVGGGNGPRGWVPPPTSHRPPGRRRGPV
ncbi:MAG: Dihydropyrimidinase, partial [uncultured Gemmatimonadaceae bacterium]